MHLHLSVDKSPFFDCVCARVYVGVVLISTEWKGVAGGKRLEEIEDGECGPVCLCAWVCKPAQRQSRRDERKIPLPRWRSHAGGTVVCVVPSGFE